MNKIAFWDTTELVLVTESHDNIMGTRIELCQRGLPIEGVTISDIDGEPEYCNLTFPCGGIAQGIHRDCFIVVE